MANMLGTISSQQQSNMTGNQRIPDFQRKALFDLMQSSKDMYGQQNAALQSQIPGIRNQLEGITNTTMPAWQQALQGGSNSGIDANNILNTIQGFSNTPSQTSGLYNQIMGGQGNSYADALKSTLQRDANRVADNMNAQLDARFAGAGMSGGARHGVAQALGYENINKGLQDNLANIGYNTFDRDLQNKLSIAQQADNNTLQRQSMFSNLANNLLGQKNDTMNNALNFGSNMQGLSMGQFSPTMMPWSNLQNYSAGIGNPIVLTNSRSTSSGSSGK